jgi:Mrp family chromosome partitioning ATPase
VAEVFERDTRAKAEPTRLSPARAPTEFEQPLEAVFARLLPLIEARGGIVVQVTAATAGEGASTIARGLAVTAARTTWCRTALVNANTEPERRISARNALPALLDRAARDGKPALRHDIIDGIVVDTGLLQQPSSGAPDMERLRWLLDALRKTYTLTVVDCPPVTLAPTVPATSRLMDGVVLVVGAEQVRTSTLMRARGHLERSGASILGVVLNRRRQRLPRFLARWL